MARDTLMLLLRHLGFTINEEVSSSDSIFWGGSGLIEFRIEPAIRKNGKDNFPVSEHARNLSGIGKRSQLAHNLVSTSIQRYLDVMDVRWTSF